MPQGKVCLKGQKVLPRVKRVVSGLLLLLLISAGALQASQVLGITEPGAKLHIQTHETYLQNQWLYVTDGQENLLAYAKVTGSSSMYLMTAQGFPVHKSLNIDQLLLKPIVTELPSAYRWYKQEATVTDVTNNAYFLSSDGEDSYTHGKSALWMDVGDTTSFITGELLLVEMEGKKLPFYVFSQDEKRTTLIQADGLKLKLSKEVVGRKITLSFAGREKHPLAPTVAVKLPSGETKKVQIPLSEIVPRMPTPKENPYKIVIDTSRNRLYLFKKGKRIKIFPVGTGRFGLETPAGTYQIIEKVKNPSWVHPSGRIFKGGGPGNPLGKYWLGLNKFGTYKGYEGQYGIHGTNRPNTVGKYVSHGCIRMLNQQIGWLFEHVPAGTPVEIVHGNRVAKTNQGGLP